MENEDLGNEEYQRRGNNNSRDFLSRLSRFSLVNEMAGRRDLCEWKEKRGESIFFFFYPVIRINSKIAFPFSLFKYLF